MQMGQRITMLRKQAGLSQAELARKAEIAQSSLHAYEAGNRPASGMSVDRAIALAKALGVSLEYLTCMYEQE